MFKDRCSDSVLGQHSAQSLYNLVLDSDDHVNKIVERNVYIDYSFVFKNISDKFIDKFSRDAMHRIIHQILPVNI
jgi:ribosome-associated toxin RatA of RatAB toxin-antitoxin module